MDRKGVYVYILQCKDNSLYTGITKDLTNRMKQHQTGQGSKYVKSRLPFKLVYSKLYKDRSSAMKREREIKKMSREKKLSLIRNWQKQGNYQYCLDFVE